jgi:predicted TIM-barrel fold metal-dependent hydrolase
MAMRTAPRIFDCDNHYYEARDAFTRHVPSNMQHRCVQWAEIDGRMRHLVGGKLDMSVTNPLFDPIGPAGKLHEYYRGNPQGLPAAELMRGQLGPQPACYRDPEARIATMDEQGVDAIWLFPTLGVLYEEHVKNDVEAVCTLFEGFNRWLDEDWGLVHDGRIFSAPYISLADVGWACSELEWALSRDARVVVMRPAAAFTAAGPRSPSHEMFDPFWARANESGITLVIHTGNSGYSSNGYANDGFGRASIGMSRRPSVKNLTLGRAAYDWLFSVACDLLFERFPNLRVASVENGSGFLPELFRNLGHARERNPWHFKEDPEALFREHVYMSPFWEDDLDEVVELMGGKHVIYGSDWPHMEGLPDPRGILDEPSNLSDEDSMRFLYGTTLELTQRRPC